MFGFLLSSTSFFAQNRSLDSLQGLLNTDKNDTNKIIHCTNLSWEFNKMGIFDSSISYANLAIKIGNSILQNNSVPQILKTAKKKQASAYYIIGIACNNMGYFNEAIKNFETALKLNQIIDGKMGIGNAYSGIGLAYFYQGNYSEALKNQFSALKIRESIGDKQGTAASLGNIGNIYFYQTDYPNALKWQEDALRIYMEIGDKRGVALSYNNLGNVYLYQKNYTDALKNYTFCMNSMEDMGDKEGMAGSLNNLGSVYESQGNHDDAIKQFNAALKLMEEMGEKNGIAGCYSNIGTSYLNQKKYDDAKRYLAKAKELSIEIGYKESLSDIYKALADIDSATGNFKGAFENHKLFMLYRDSLDNEETRKKTIQTQMTYDFEKKEAVANAEHKKELENQASLSNEKSRKQIIIIGFVVFGFLLVVLFSGFIFRSLRITRKQKAMIEIQKNIVEEKQKEILDSIHYAKRIQKSLLPTERYIDKNLSRLKEN